MICKKTGLNKLINSLRKIRYKCWENGFGLSGEKQELELQDFVRKKGNFNF